MTTEEKLAALQAETLAELADTPTREERAEATKWLGYEWDGILKFLRWLDSGEVVDIPDELRREYQEHLMSQKLEAVRRKSAAANEGLLKPIR